MVMTLIMGMALQSKCSLTRKIIKCQRNIGVESPAIVLGTALLFSGTSLPKTGKPGDS